MIPPSRLQTHITSSLSNRAIILIVCSFAKSSGDAHESTRALKAQKLEARLSNLPENMNSLLAPPRQLGWVSQTFNSMLTIFSALQPNSSDRI